MNDLLRPSLYDAWHEITALHGEARPSVRYDVVGPVCETPLLAEILLNDGRYAVVRGRQTYEEMIGADRLPGTWLTP